MGGALRVVDVFATVQGEGSRAGSPAVFVRFAGCNLWSGREADRERGRGGCAAWCDTVFVGGDRVGPVDLADRVDRVARDVGFRRPLVVLSGGEPTLQLSSEAGRRFVHRLRTDVRHDGIAIETNGTNVVPDGIDHVTVSPKPLRGAGGLAHVVQRAGTDLKVVVPTPFDEAELHELGRGFRHRFVQPRDDGGGGLDNVAHAIEVAGRLGWRVSVQTHKLLGLP